MAANICCGWTLVVASNISINSNCIRRLAVLSAIPLAIKETILVVVEANSISPGNSTHDNTNNSTSTTAFSKPLLPLQVLWFDAEFWWIFPSYIILKMVFNCYFVYVVKILQMFVMVWAKPIGYTYMQIKIPKHTLSFNLHFDNGF